MVISKEADDFLSVYLRVILSGTFALCSFGRVGECYLLKLLRYNGIQYLELRAGLRFSQAWRLDFMAYSSHKSSFDGLQGVLNSRWH